MGRERVDDNDDKHFPIVSCPLSFFVFCVSIVPVARMGVAPETPYMYDRRPDSKRPYVVRYVLSVQVPMLIFYLSHSR